MRARRFVPAVVLALALGSGSVAAADTPSQPAQPACFGAYASTFAQTNPASGRLVAGVATSAPGAVGAFAATKPMCP